MRCTGNCKQLPLAVGIIPQCCCYKVLLPGYTIPLSRRQKRITTSVKSKQEKTTGCKIVHCPAQRCKSQIASAHGSLARAAPAVIAQGLWPSFTTKGNNTLRPCWDSTYRYLEHRLLSASAIAAAALQLSWLQGLKRLWHCRPRPGGRQVCLGHALHWPRARLRPRKLLV